MLTAIAWTLTYFYFDPSGSDSTIINILAYLFVVGFDALVPVYMLITNIRKTNLLWGVVAFLYQIIATATAAILILLVFTRLNDD